MRTLCIFLLLLLVCSHVRAAETWLPNTTDGTLRPVSKPGGGYYSIRLPDSNSSHFVNLLFGDITAARTFTVDLGDASRTLTLTGNAVIGGTNTGDQTITLTGDVTGSGTGSFAVTIAADAVALATDTTGDYVATITAGAGINMTGAASGENISHSISATLGTSIIAAEIDDDVIDFADMADSMTLDANLAIGASASNFSVNIDSNTLFVDTLNNRVGVGMATPGYPLEVGAFNVAGPNIKTGSIELQPYSLNNAFIGENSYYGSGWKYRAGGSAGLFYFAGPEGHFRFYTAGGAGAALPNSGNSVQFKVNADGTVAMGDQGNNLIGNYTGSSLVVKSGGIVGVNDATPDASLEVLNDGVGDSFLVADTNDGDASPFVVTSAGLTGIGTGSPATVLHVVGASTLYTGSDGQLDIGITGALSNKLRIGFDTTNNVGWIQATTEGTANRPLYLNPNSGNVVLAKEAGVVGIGNDATPDASLEVVNDGVGDSFLVADTNDGDASPFKIDSAGVVTTGGNVGLGQTAFGTSATKTLAIGSGTAPTTSPADAFQMYSADIAAGEASPHFRTEDGDIIKLFQSAANADTTGATLGDLETELNQMKQIMRDHGFLAP